VGTLEELGKRSLALVALVEAGSEVLDLGSDGLAVGTLVQRVVGLVTLLGAESDLAAWAAVELDDLALLLVVVGLGLVAGSIGAGLEPWDSAHNSVFSGDRILAVELHGVAASWLPGLAWHSRETTKCRRFALFHETVNREALHGLHTCAHDLAKLWISFWVGTDCGSFAVRILGV
jgi:hypothetical protein